VCGELAGSAEEGQPHEVPLGTVAHLLPAPKVVWQELGVVKVVGGAERPENGNSFEHFLALRLTQQGFTVRPHLEGGSRGKVAAGRVNEKQKGALVLA
jgi:hypothetical protein